MILTKRMIAAAAAVPLAAGMSMAFAGTAAAAPTNPQANCTAIEASTVGDISFFAQLKAPYGAPNPNASYVADASSTDCSAP